MATVAVLLVVLMQDPVPRGERILAMDVNEAKDGDFGKAFTAARAAGMQVANLSVYWDDIETKPGTYAPVMNYLAISNVFYPAAKTPLNLVVAVLDTSRRRIPRDLARKPLDDPELIERFKKLLDWAFEQIPNVTLGYLSIGNEIDGVIRSEREWKQYQAFFAAAKAHAAAKRPGLKIGVKLMLDGALKADGKALNALADVVMVNAYALNGDFTVRDPSAVEGIFDAVVEAYPGRTIYFTEWGYPSGAACKSTDEQQADFVRRSFKAWDKHAGAVRLVNFCILHDRPDSFVKDSAQYYGLKLPAFLEFLRTLGMRTFDGKDKPAFAALKAEARSRGW
jgi:hypothetical protein